jgi:DNA-binding NtrC family response regulator
VLERFGPLRGRAHIHVDIFVCCHDIIDCVSHFDLLDALRHVAVLRHLPLGQLDRLAARSRRRVFEPGSVLIEEGERGDEVFVLLEGRVAVRLALPGGERRAVAIRGAGELVGEMALLDDLPRSATVTAEGEVVALAIPRAAFVDAVGTCAAAALDLVRTLSLRLRESDAAQTEALRAKAERLASSNRSLARENRRLLSELDRRFGFEAFVGSSAAAEGVREAGRRAAASDLPVLLVGETGTGKELLARAIHAASERRERPFVALNCALFSESLLESELFGHARGAFTGAHAAKPGLVEEADGGTLFLDELADMPRPTQAALLRFLELGEFRRIGETQARRADARVVAALHVGVEEALASGSVRRDLHFRLDVFRIPLPPLRERRDDVPEVAARLVQDAATRLGCEPIALEPDAMEVLRACDFPGNVRELRNEIERLYATHGGGTRVGAQALSARLAAGDPKSAGGYSSAVRAFKAKLLREALERAEGSRAAAARALGLHPSNLLRMIREFGVEVPAPRGGGAAPGGRRRGGAAAP